MPLPSEPTFPKIESIPLVAYDTKIYEQINHPERNHQTHTLVSLLCTYLREHLSERLTKDCSVGDLCPVNLHTFCTENTGWKEEEHTAKYSFTLLRNQTETFSLSLQLRLQMVAGNTSGQIRGSRTLRALVSSSPKSSGQK